MAIKREFNEVDITAMFDTDADAFSIGNPICNLTKW